jgi:hypothetical protein
VAICISALDIVIGLVKRKGRKLSLIKQPGGHSVTPQINGPFRSGRIEGAENYAELRGERAVSGRTRFIRAAPAVLKFTSL